VVTIGATFLVATPAQARITSIQISSWWYSVPAHSVSGPLRISCPWGRQVTGGGGEATTPAVKILASYPGIDNSFNPPVSYWEIRARNDTGSTQTVKVWSICAAGIISYHHAAKNVSVPPQSWREVQANCPSGYTSMGGGYWTQNNSVIASVSEVSGSGWFVRAFNTGSTTTSFNAYATCSGTASIGSRRVLSSTNTLGPNGQAVRTHTCASNEFVTGGGFDKSPVDNWTIISASIPVEANGWTRNFLNLNPSVTYTVQSTTVCFQR
jgi:hypothetical protein